MHEYTIYEGTMYVSTVEELFCPQLAHPWLRGNINESCSGY